MPYSGQTFTIVNLFIPGTTIESSAVNQNFNDIASNGLSVVVKLNGDSVMTGQFKAANGSDSAPSITFGSDTNVGFYRISADTIGVAVNGALVATYNSSGLTLASGAQFIGTDGTASEPDYTFAGDLDTGFYHEGANKIGVAVNATKVAEFNTSGLSVTGTVDATGGFTISGAPVSFVSPGGRLTLSTGVPVLITDVTAATTIYYTPYLNGYAALYNGTTWVTVSYSELSQALSDNTKSPSATTANNNYDMFLWDDGGTIRCTRGPAWSSSTARGTGAGTTELTTQNGILVNANAITNGPVATRGLYVGTIRTNASNQVAVLLAPSAAAGGTANTIYCWNYYNRVPISSICRDSTNTWSYSGGANTWQSANASTSNRISMVIGINDCLVKGSYNVASTFGLGGLLSYAGVGFDSTTVFTGTSGVCGSATITGQNYGYGSAYPGIGLRFVQALESANTTANVTFYGDNNTPTVVQMMLSVEYTG